MQVNTNSTTRQSVSVNMTINSVKIKQVFICVWYLSLFDQCCKNETADLPRWWLVTDTSV